ncbi:interferon-induced very large GTPase 1-like [Oratosquilla oratoria]|uniref:interferon-induced very large GTPase 1-like n=1 Tax=Oratosquilla oratoria TaxID=337810 RepID=UPI003F77758F
MGKGKRNRDKYRKWQKDESISASGGRRGSENMTQTEDIGNSNRELKDIGSSDPIGNRPEVMQTLLSTLGLEEYFPKKIKLDHVIALTYDCKNQKATYKDLPWVLLQRLFTIDFRARDEAVSKSNDSTLDEVDNNVFNLDDFLDGSGLALGNELLHPQDVFLATFICCDLIVRQHLLTKVFICKLAVPVLYPTFLGGAYEQVLWSLRGVVVEWKDESGITKEKDIVSLAHKSVSFVRLGSPRQSKSKLLNQVLRDQGHPTFFNGNSHGGTNSRRVSTGVVEGAWYLPSGKQQDFFTEVTMFLNLRGDARKLPIQTRYLIQFSSIVVCLFRVEDVLLDDVRDTLATITGKAKFTLILLCGRKEVVNEEVKEYLKLLKGSNQINIIPAWDDSQVHGSKQIHILVRQKLAKLLSEEGCKFVTLDRIETKYLEKVYMDEEDSACKKGKALAHSLHHILEEYTKSKSVTDIVPLQGNLLNKWSRLLKEQSRSYSGGEKSLETQDDIRQRMLGIRRQQVSLAKELGAVMTFFISNLEKIADQKDKTAFYITWLRLILEKRTREVVPVYRAKYNEKWMEYKDACRDSTIEESVLSELQKCAQEAEREVAHNVFEVQHLLREVGQIYECISETKSQGDFKNFYEKLPGLMVSLLLLHQPLEIFDGESSTVPMTWLKAVFEELQERLGDKKLFVLSVLGTQSSGKSTLLNTMFGMHFAVSAGRCTKGIYAQLLPVSTKSGDTLPFDYLLVVDTEGIRAPELGHKGYIHDNELSTLAIGLGNLTLINVKGESSGEITDVLQIVIHAFLRMRAVQSNVNLRQSCMFVHQNVPALGAKEKNTYGKQKLEDTLDVMTVEAAKQENVTNIASFKDVIRFDDKDSVHYFSDLWQGDPPMAPSNTGYSEKALELKNNIIGQTLAEQGNNLSVGDVLLRLDDLWKAILTEDFVFSFRNTVEAKAYRDLESKYYNIVWGLEIFAGNWCQETGENELRSCDSSSLDDCQRDLQKQFEQLFEEERKKAIKNLELFFSENSSRNILIQWKTYKLDAMKLKGDVILANVCRCLQELKDEQKNLAEERALQMTIEKDILREASLYASKSNGTNLENDELRKLQFENFWKFWRPDLEVDLVDSGNLESHLREALFEAFHDNKLLVNKYLETEDLKTPLETTLVNSIQSNSIKNDDYSCQSWINAVFDFFSMARALNELIDSIQSILSPIEVHIEEVCSHDTKFSPVHSKTMLQKLMDEVSNNDNKFKLNKKLQLRLAVNSCRFALPKFQEMEAAYRRRHTQVGKTAKLKEIAWTQFQLQVRKASEEAVICNLLVGQLKDIVRETAMKNVQNQMVEDCLIHFNLKYHLILSILDHLAKEEDFNEYIDYIHNPSAYAQKWLHGFVAKRYFMHGKASKSFAERARGKTTVIIDCILDSIQATQERARGSEEFTMCEWVDSFCTKVKSQIAVPSQALHMISDMRIDNFDRFHDTVVKKIRKLQEELNTYYESVTMSSIRWNEASPPSTLMSKLWGCTANCPFCKEPCKETDPDHTASKVNHSCVQHKPLAVSGWTFRGSRIPVLKHCNYDIHNNSQYYCSNLCRKHGCSSTDDGFLHNYRDYKEFFPDWDIAPLPEIDSTPYWMWFFSTYHSQLIKWYSTKPANIPESWKQITKEDALKSLRKIT